MVRNQQRKRRRSNDLFTHQQHDQRRDQSQKMEKFEEDFF